MPDDATQLHGKSHCRLRLIIERSDDAHPWRLVERTVVLVLNEPQDIDGDRSIGRQLGAKKWAEINRDIADEILRIIRSHTAG